MKALWLAVRVWLLPPPNRARLREAEPHNCKVVTYKQVLCEGRVYWGLNPITRLDPNTKVTVVRVSSSRVKIIGDTNETVT